MTRGEFLETLRAQLQGELSPAQIEGHLHYYREYIAEAMAAGKSEREVLEELGSPVLIARTLVDTAEASGDYADEEDSLWSSGGEERYDDASQDEYYGRRVHTYHISPLVLKWGVPIALFLILFLVFTLVGSVLALLMRFLVPILVIALVIYLLRRAR